MVVDKFQSWAVTMTSEVLPLTKLNKNEHSVHTLCSHVFHCTADLPEAKIKKPIPKDITDRQALL